MAWAEPALHSINLTSILAETDHSSLHERPWGRLLLNFINPDHENVSQKFHRECRKGNNNFIFLNAVVGSCWFSYLKTGS